MAKSTAPILAIGGVVVFSDVLLWGEIKDFKPLVATGFAAVAFALLEKINQPLAVGVAWIAFITTIMVRKNAGNATLFDQLDSLLHSDWRGETSWTKYQP